MLDSNIQLFADDTKIYRTIQSQSNALAMQKDIKINDLVQDLAAAFQ